MDEKSSFLHFFSLWIVCFLARSLDTESLLLVYCVLCPNYLDGLKRTCSNLKKQLVNLIMEVLKPGNNTISTKIATIFFNGLK